MLDPLEALGRGAAHQPVHLVALLEEQLSQIRAILARNPRDQRAASPGHARGRLHLLPGGARPHHPARSPPPATGYPPARLATVPPAHARASAAERRTADSAVGDEGTGRAAGAGGVRPPPRSGF